MKQGAEKRKLKDSTETLDSQVKKAKEEKPAAGVKEVDLVSKGISRPSAAAHVQVHSRVVKTDHLFRNSPSKPSNGQPSEGLLQTFFVLKAITTSCLELKFSNCPMLYPKVSN